VLSERLADTDPRAKNNTIKHQCWASCKYFKM